MNYDLSLQEEICENIKSYLAGQYGTEVSKVPYSLILQTYDLLQQENDTGTVFPIGELITNSLLKHSTRVAFKWNVSVKS